MNPLTVWLEVNPAEIAERVAAAEKAVGDE